MIAFASRYGNQPLLVEIGEVTADGVSRFCDALRYWIDNESKNGRSYAMTATGGG